MPAYQNWTLRRGRQWKLDLRWKIDGKPVDISDYTSWALRSEDPPGLDLTEGSGITIVDAAGGRIVVLLTATDTADLEFRRAAYALEYVDPDGVPDSLLEGDLLLDLPAP